MTREQADDADMQPRRRPARAAGAAQTCQTSRHDDADQQQATAPALISRTANDDVARRLDRRQASEHDEGQDGRQQREPTATGVSRSPQGHPSRRTDAIAAAAEVSALASPATCQLKASRPPLQLMHHITMLPNCDNSTGAALAQCATCSDCDNADAACARVAG